MATDLAVKEAIKKLRDRYSSVLAEQNVIGDALAQDNSEKFTNVLRAAMRNPSARALGLFSAITQHYSQESRSLEADIEAFRKTPAYQALGKNEKASIDVLTFDGIKSFRYEKLNSPQAIDRQIRMLADESRFLSDELAEARKQDPSTNGWSDVTRQRHNQLVKFHGQISAIGFGTAVEKFKIDTSQKGQLDEIWNQLASLGTWTKGGKPDLTGTFTPGAITKITQADTRKVGDSTLVELEASVQALSTEILENDKPNGGKWNDTVKLRAIIDRYNALAADFKLNRLTRDQGQALAFIGTQVEQLNKWAASDGGGPVDAKDTIHLNYILHGTGGLVQLEKDIVAFSEAMKAKDGKFETADKEALTALTERMGTFNDDRDYLHEGQAKALDYIKNQIESRLVPWAEGKKSGGAINPNGSEALNYYLRAVDVPAEIAETEPEVEADKPEDKKDDKKVDQKADGGSADKKDKPPADETEAQRSARMKNENSGGGGGAREGHEHGGRGWVERGVDGATDTLRQGSRALDIKSDNPLDQAADGWLDWMGDGVSNTFNYVSSSLSGASMTSNKRSWISLAAGGIGAIMAPSRILSFLEAQVPMLKGLMDNVPGLRSLVLLAGMFFTFKGIRKGMHSWLGGNEADEAEARANTDAASQADSSQHRASEVEARGSIRNPQDVRPAPDANREAAAQAERARQAEEARLATENAEKVRLALEAEQKRKAAEANANPNGEEPVEMKAPPKREGKGAFNRIPTQSHDATRLGSTPVNFVEMNIPVGIPLQIRDGLAGLHNAEIDAQRTVPGQGGNANGDASITSEHGDDVSVQTVVHSRFAVASEPTTQPWLAAKLNAANRNAGHTSQFSDRTLS